MPQQDTPRTLDMLLLFIYVALVVLLDASEPEFDVARVDLIRRRLSDVTLLVMVSVSDHRMLRRAPELLRRGVDDLWVVDGDHLDPIGLASAVEDALAGRVTRRVTTALASHIPSFLRSFVEELWRRCWRPLSPSDAGALYHRDPSTLQRQLRAAGLPSLNQMIIWGRLFVAGSLLERGGRSVDGVAAVLAFPSANALRNQLRRYADAAPTDIRRAGLMLLVDGFVRRCDAEESGVLRGARRKA